MVRITVELIRKRSEHNEGEISTLEEITLHQENIEKIELINRLCKDLKILLLQNNLIAKIENLSRLKLLEYLNLALNNIEVIENLEGLESLKKLDLTVNFIGDLRGIKKLRANEHLSELFLTGNPCADYNGYRAYAISCLPQLNELDGREITRTERIKSLQCYSEAEGDVIRDYWNYMKIRAKQLDNYRESQLSCEISEIINDEESQDDEEATETFWNSKSHHTPEDRIQIAKKMEKIEMKKNHKTNKKQNVEKYVVKFFSPEGRPYNINQARVPFRLNDEDDPRIITLEVSTYRHMDTSLIDVDVQPNYVRLTIKGKVLQLSLPSEVMTDKSVAKRNIITGNLDITMPRLNPGTVVKCPIASINKQKEKRVPKVMQSSSRSKRELLEIGPPTDDLDFSNIYKDKASRKRSMKGNCGQEVSNDFFDDPEVPPLV